MSRLLKKAKDGKIGNYQFKKTKDGQLSISKKGMLSSSSTTIGSKGYSSKKKGLLSSSETDLSKDGYSSKKKGLLSSSETKINQDGIDHKEKSLLSSNETKIDQDGIDHKEKSLLSSNETSISKNGVDHAEQSLLSSNQTSINKNGVDHAEQRLLSSNQTSVTKNSIEHKEQNLLTTKETSIHANNSNVAAAPQFLATRIGSNVSVLKTETIKNRVRYEIQTSAIQLPWTPCSNQGSATVMVYRYYTDFKKIHAHITRKFSSSFAKKGFLKNVLGLNKDKIPAPPRMTDSGGVKNYLKGHSKLGTKKRTSDFNVLLEYMATTPGVNQDVEVCEFLGVRVN